MFHQGLTKFFSDIDLFIKSDHFLNLSRTSNKSFTRNRALPFHFLIYLLLNFLCSSCQNELNQFLKTIHTSLTVRLSITKIALTQARAKLKSDAFSVLNNYVVKQFYSLFKTRKSFSFRLSAIDRKSIQIPKNVETNAYFERWKSKNRDLLEIPKISYH